jgi:hypothetical protein
MDSAFRILCYILVFGLVSCAPSVTPKTDTAASGSGPAASSAPGSDGRAGEGARGGAREADTGSSSLKQLQEGKSPVTPASSPLKDIYFDFDRYDLSADARTIFCVVTPSGSRAIRTLGWRSRAIAMIAGPTNTTWRWALNGPKRYGNIW